MDKATIGVCLLIHQRARNKAIGIGHDPQHLRGLSVFLRSVGKDETKAHIRALARGVYLKAMIEEHTALAGKLDVYILANIENDEIRNNGLEAMTKLESYISHLGDELEKML